ncbi:Fic family protein [Caballeronia ptereochthonis]|uniref:Fic family protein n=1 Tax=Caballeronia ptereochthonis TaxID=1777144 RepID=UPI00313462D0
MRSGCPTKVMDKERRRADIQHLLKLSDPEHFRKAYLVPTLESGLIEMTVPGKPTSPNQKYRLTHLGLSYRRRLPADR